jgi:hypothetical protein
MLWNRARKTETSSLKNSPIDSDLNVAETETVKAPAPAPVEQNSEAEQPAKPGFFSRFFAKAKPEEKFQIQPKWAIGATKALFVPLAKYQHPAWALSDEEAETVRPEMQTFLQAMFDRYVPSLLNSWASKHSEFTNLFLALGTLLYVKAKQVNESVAQAEALNKVIEMPEPSDTEVKAEPASARIPQLCGRCQKEFKSQEEYRAHLSGCVGAN